MHSSVHEIYVYNEMLWLQSVPQSTVCPDGEKENEK